jgi:energy-coupling factor transport system ATP-binding protein
VDGPPALAPAAVARSVRVRYPGATAWTPDKVEVEVAPGEVLLILGPSGCGKSTFALSFNGLVPHAVPAEFAGTMTVGGVSTREASVAELSERVAMVFQDPEAQLVTRTVLDEVCFGPENRLVPAAEVEARAEAALRAVGLWDRRDENPEILSGGGKQRLAIACALALGSPLLVLDEPTSSLDPAGAEEVYRLLGELTAPGSTRSVVLVEHDLDLALGIVNTVLVLDGAGRPFASGPVREVLRARAEDLEALGVWLPTPTTAALRMRRAGIPLDPLPLTVEELAAALADLDVDSAAEEPSVTEEPSGTGSDPDAEALPALPAVSVTGLTVKRGGRRILSEVSLRVPRGDFLAVVGPNGAGKSTLVQSLAGVLRVPRGTVDVLGLDPARASGSALRETIGFVFQNPEHQFVAHTVEDELALGLRQRRLPETEVSARVDGMLTLLDLHAHRSSHPFLLSGGQKRRLSVGTALIEGAPVLVLDEPTFGQDRARAADLLELLAALNASGTTVIAVTHDLGLIGQYARHVAILDEGRVVALDETARILSDRALLEAHALRQPPLVRALAGPSIPAELRGLTRLADLPGLR